MRNAKPGNHLNYSLLQTNFEDDVPQHQQIWPCAIIFFLLLYSCLLTFTANFSVKILNVIYIMHWLLKTLMTLNWPINWFSNKFFEQQLGKKNYVIRGFGSDMPLVRRTQIYGSGAWKFKVVCPRSGSCNLNILTLLLCPMELKIKK